jgi:hypothetical protein
MTAPTKTGALHIGAVRSRCVCRSSRNALRCNCERVFTGPGSALRDHARYISRPVDSQAGRATPRRRCPGTGRRDPRRTPRIRRTTGESAPRRSPSARRSALRHRIPRSRRDSLSSPAESNGVEATGSGTDPVESLIVRSRRGASRCNEPTRGRAGRACSGRRPRGRRSAAVRQFYPPVGASRAWECRDPRWREIG